MGTKSVDQFDFTAYTRLNLEIFKSSKNKCILISFLSESIGGFTCPKEKTLGPHGQPLAHPSFPHPESCQKFITCYFSTDIKELGCMKGQVFDYKTNKCTDPLSGPGELKRYRVFYG